MKELELWLPLGRNEYQDFMNRFLPRVCAIATELGMPDQEKDKTMTLHNAFNVAFLANDPPESRNRITGRAEQRTREELTVHARHIRWDYVEPALNNHKITDIQYQALGLKVRENKHTPKPDPTDHVSIDLRIDGISHIVSAHYRITGSTHRSKRPYHGVEARIWVLAPDAPPPTTADFPGWQSEISTASPWSRTFKAQDLGKRLYIAMRWVNESVGNDGKRGKGPWSEIQSILIA
jgi:hypothetical protein